MSDLVIYKKSRQLMSEVEFVKDVNNQLKIRDIKDSYELTKQVSLVFVSVINHLGIKESLSQITKQDIMDMLLSRFKNLSMDEVSYSFKLERYGILGIRKEHFQLFNAEYVGDVLGKYIKWKIEVKSLHKIVPEIKEVQVSESYKKYWINIGVTNAFEYFKENENMKTGYLYVYDILYDKGYLPTDKSYKSEILKSAIECIEIEQQLLKKGRLSSRDAIKSVLSRIKNLKDPLVIQKCKEIVLCQFFRNLLKDIDEITLFLNTFKPQGEYEKKI